MRLADLKNKAGPMYPRRWSRRRRQGLDMMAVVIKTMLSEGKSFDFQFNIDQKQDDVGMTLTLDAKKKSLMATTIGIWRRSDTFCSRIRCCSSCRIELHDSRCVSTVYQHCGDGNSRQDLYGKLIRASGQSSRKLSMRLHRRSKKAWLMSILPLARRNRVGLSTFLRPSASKTARRLKPRFVIW